MDKRKESSEYSNNVSSIKIPGQHGLTNNATKHLVSLLV